MKKDRFNSLFRAFVRDHLSPTPAEREFVTSVYAAIQNVLGEANCLQIGSYPRFTAISPLHDLDVLFILGPWIKEAEAQDELQTLETRLLRYFHNPTVHSIDIRRQTHSVTISFLSEGKEVFAVDLVPAYIRGRNDFGDDMYMVPEIATKSRRERQRIILAVAEGRREMAWIPTDPRGYIRVARELNVANSDFRKSVKLVKGWKQSCCEMDDDAFPLKSFHLEQIITENVLFHPGIELFDIVFQLFRLLPEHIQEPHIPDRADPSKRIDAYVADLTDAERSLAVEARDCFLIKLEEFEDDDTVGWLLEACRHTRAGPAEAYLFDQGIPMLTESAFSITGQVQARHGFRSSLLGQTGQIAVDRKIKFKVGPNAPLADLFKWKVKNDDNSPQPRGEITDHRTASDPEHTMYKGRHFVECYAILDGRCIARAKQYVVLRSGL